MKISKIALTMMSTLAVSTSVFAASTGTLLLQGTVSEVMDISVNPTGDNLLLNIKDGDTNKSVATVSETSNRLSGYKIKLYSDNGGELRHTVDPSIKTTYTISYNHQTFISPTTTAQTVKTVSPLTGLTTETSSVNVNVDGLSTAAAGIYQDTVHLSIEAN